MLIAPSINPSFLEGYYPIDEIDEIVSWVDFEVIIKAIMGWSALMLPKSTIIDQPLHDWISVGVVVTDYPYQADHF